MTTSFVIDSVNAGLTKVLKDIAETYDNVELSDLMERYVTKSSSKKTKRKGHVSNYNMYVKMYRPDIAKDNPNLSFKEISAKLGQNWTTDSKNEDIVAKVEAFKATYLSEKNCDTPCDTKATDAAPVESGAPVKAKRVVKKKAKAKA